MPPAINAQPFQDLNLYAELLFEVKWKSSGKRNSIRIRFPENKFTEVNIDSNPHKHTDPELLYKSLLTSPVKKALKEENDEVEKETTSPDGQCHDKKEFNSTSEVDSSQANDEKSLQSLGDAQLKNDHRPRESMFPDGGGYLNTLHRISSFSPILKLLWYNATVTEDSYGVYVPIENSKGIKRDQILNQSEGIAAAPLASNENKKFLKIPVRKFSGDDLEIYGYLVITFEIRSPSHGNRYPSEKRTPPSVKKRLGIDTDSLGGKLGIIDNLLISSFTEHQTRINYVSGLSATKHLKMKSAIFQNFDLWEKKLTESNGGPIPSVNSISVGPVLVKSEMNERLPTSYLSESIKNFSSSDENPHAQQSVNDTKSTTDQNESSRDLARSPDDQTSTLTSSGVEKKADKDQSVDDSKIKDESTGQETDIENRSAEKHRSVDDSNVEDKLTGQEIDMPNRSESNLMQNRLSPCRSAQFRSKNESSHGLDETLNNGIQTLTRASFQSKSDTLDKAMTDMETRIFDISPDSKRASKALYKMGADSAELLKKLPSSKYILESSNIESYSGKEIKSLRENIEMDQNETLNSVLSWYPDEYPTRRGIGRAVIVAGQQPQPCERKLGADSKKSTLTSHTSQKESELLPSPEVLLPDEPPLLSKTVTQSIGVAGGTISSSGCSVTFPKYAFEEVQTVSVTVKIDASACPSDREIITPCLTVKAKDLKKAATVRLKSWCFADEQQDDIIVEILRRVDSEEYEVIHSCNLPKFDTIEFECDHFCSVFAAFRKFIYPANQCYNIYPTLYFPGCRFVVALLKNPDQEREVCLEIVEGNWGPSRRGEFRCTDIVCQKHDKISCKFLLPDQSVGILPKEHVFEVVDILETNLPSSKDFKCELNGEDFDEISFVLQTTKEIDYSIPLYPGKQGITSKKQAASGSTTATSESANVKNSSPEKTQDDEQQQVPILQVESKAASTESNENVPPHSSTQPVVNVCFNFNSPSTTVANNIADHGSHLTYSATGAQSTTTYSSNENKTQ